MDPYRIQRVTEALREELSEIISLELADPRVQGIELTDVHISPDLRLASVRLAIPEQSDPAQALDAMHHAKSFIKRQLAQRLDLRHVPDLRFEADLSPQASAQVAALLRRARRGRPRDAESFEKSEKNS